MLILEMGWSSQLHQMASFSKYACHFELRSSYSGRHCCFSTGYSTSNHFEKLKFNYLTFQNASFIEWPRYDLVPQNVNGMYPFANGTKIMLGNMWPIKNVAYPDFLDETNRTRDWWTSEFINFRNTVCFIAAQPKGNL